MAATRVAKNIFDPLVGEGLGSSGIAKRIASKTSQFKTRNFNGIRSGFPKLRRIGIDKEENFSEWADTNAEFEVRLP
jgi:hypothetical protein